MDGDIAPVSDKISHRLLGRHQASALLAELLAADDSLSLDPYYQQLLTYGRDLLAVLPRFLDTAEPRALVRLGLLLSSYPDSGAVVQALRQVALQDSSSDTRRMAAMVILEQSLDQALGPEYFSSLRDPGRVVADSLVRVLAGARDDRNLLLAYLVALEEQHPAARATVLDAVAELPTESSINVLRLLAQHEDEALSSRAILKLLTMNTPEALLVLRELTLVLPLLPGEKLQRSLRKLLLRGCQLPPFNALPTTARALQTPIDTQGSMVFWFIVPGADGQAQLLSLFANDEDGICEAFGGDRFSPESFPPPRPTGTVHQDIDTRMELDTRLQAALVGDWSLTPDAALIFPEAANAADAPPEDDENPSLPFDFLEVDFDYARGLVLDFQALNWAAERPLPLEYRLLHDIIWRFGPPAAYTVKLPRPASRSRTLEFPLLFDTAPFRSWFLQGVEVDVAANRLLQAHGSVLLDELPRAGLLDASATPLGVAGRDVLQTAAVLADEFFGLDPPALLASRIKRAAEWLAISGDEDASSLALLAAAQLDAEPASRNYFAILLAQRGLLRAIGRVNDA